MSPTPNRYEDPASDDDARRAIIGVMREACPNSFMSEAESDETSKLTPARRKRILDLASHFPRALNLLDIDGRTPLAWLVRYDEPALIQAFLALGAHPRGAAGTGDARGVHPLAQAAELRHGPSLEAIALAAGVEDVVVEPCHSRYDAENACSGARVLFMAAFTCNRRGIATLLGLGADPESTTVNGDSAMHALAYGRKNPSYALPCLDLLAKACPGLALRRNTAGQTPAALAASHGSSMAGPLLALEEAARLGLDARGSAPVPKGLSARL